MDKKSENKKTLTEHIGDRCRITIEPNYLTVEFQLPDGDFYTFYKPEFSYGTAKSLLVSIETDPDVIYKFVPQNSEWEYAGTLPENELDNVWHHRDICDEIHQLYVRKNHDYGDSFHQTFLEEGFAMSRIRLSDKLSRFKTLSRAGSESMVNDESLRDTLIDLANYAMMTAMEIDRKEK